MERGQVYKIPVNVPNRKTGLPEIRDKYVVILRGGQGTATETDVPYVLASSDDDRPSGAPHRTFEVPVGVPDGFHHATVIDCRWVYTVLKATRFPAGSYQFTLSAEVMQRVSVALVSGLQMYVTPTPPAPAPAPTAP